MTYVSPLHNCPGLPGKPLEKPCRVWTGALTYWGYGHRYVRTPDGPKLKLLHRLAWEENYGPIPDGLFVLHACDNPPCYEPTHLFLGTARDNIRDAMNKGRLNPRCGVTHPRAKLDPDKVRAIRKAHGHRSSRDLAREYGVDPHAIRDIYKGVTWKEVV